MPAVEPIFNTTTSGGTQVMGGPGSANGPSQPSTLPIPPGQNPLGSLPQYGGAGGGTQAAQYYAGQQFFKTFGRNPSQQELDQLTPAYLSSDPNKANLAGGNAAVANYFQQQSNTPQQIYQQQQSQYAQQAGKYADPVNQTFQSIMGRAPTQAEQQYFGSLMASGQDQYQIQQALQQTQEYQNTQNTNFQNQLQGQLQQSNSTYFNQYIAPSLQAQNALSGQAPGSTALSSQLSNAALQQNQGLQNFLAGVSAQNYQNSTANATNQYNQLMGQQYGLQNAGVTNALQNQQSNNAYNQQLNLYQLQQQAYNNYLNQYGKRSTLQNVASGVGIAQGIGQFLTNPGGFGGGAGAGGGSSSSGFNSTAGGTSTWGSQGGAMAAGL